MIEEKISLKPKNNLVNIMTDSIIDWVITTYDHFETVTAQLISKCLFGVIDWTKKPTKFFPGFLP